MAGKTLADVYVDGELVPAGSDASHPLSGKISNPAAWEDGKVPASVAEDEAPAGNASTEVWAEYAKSKGVKVPEGAGREDIKALLGQ